SAGGAGSGGPLFFCLSPGPLRPFGEGKFLGFAPVSRQPASFPRGGKKLGEREFVKSLEQHPGKGGGAELDTAKKRTFFTREAAPPKRVAADLLAKGIDYFTAYVCENLGSPDERVTHGELAELKDHDFAPLNVMILVRKPNVPDRPVESIGRRLFGNPDELFL